MKTERLEINGEALDLNDGDRLALSLSSNLLKGLDDYTSCYTYSYTVPNTPRNRRLLGELLLPGASARKVRQYVPAVYFRDGVQILEGSIVVTKADGDGFELSMLFGLSNLKALKDDDKSLYELGWAKDCPITVDENGDETGLVFRLANETRTLPAFYMLMNEYYYPDYTVGESPRIPAVVRVADILAQIESDYGVTLGLDAGEDLLQFAPVWRKGGSVTFSSAVEGRTLTYKGNYYLNYAFSWTYSGDVFDEDIDEDSQKEHCAPRLFSSGGVIESIKITITADRNNPAYAYIVTDPSLTFHACLDKDNQPRTSDGFVGMVEAGQTATFEKTPAELNIAEEYEDFAVAILSPNTWQSTAAGAAVSVEVVVSLEYQEAEQGKFYAANCLPDISAADFVTQYAAVRFGKFPVNQLRGGNEIKFASLEDVAGATPYDWTDKLLDGSMTHSWTMDDLAQKNYLNWAEDNSEPVFEQGAFDVELDTDDDTIEEETDLSECSFSYSYRPAGSARMLTHYKGEDVDPAPRIVQIDPDATQGNPRDGSDTTEYAAYASAPLYWRTSGTLFELAVWSPAVLECSVELSTPDLLTLDLARPVFFKQYGKFYYIMSAQVDGRNIAKCKLLEIKKTK